MYDDPLWCDNPWREDPPEPERLTHLTFLDGRLVSSWSEPVLGTRWEAAAHRLDRDRLTPPPPPPPPPLHEQVLSWLTEVCGSPAALTALNSVPLAPEAGQFPAAWPDRESEERMCGAADLLDDLADRFFDPESGVAFRVALLAVWAEEPSVVGRSSGPDTLAAGIAWVVGKANGLFAPLGHHRVALLREALDVPGQPASYGAGVRGALRGFRGHPDQVRRPAAVPDLMALARTDVLTSPTRSQLVRLRDRAAAAAREAA